MRIINRKSLDSFKRKHPLSRKPLSLWEQIICNSEYQNLNDLKATFGGKVDYLSSGYTVFDIGGNNYRLITIIDYSYKLVEIKVLWTHGDYNNPKNAEDLRRGRV